jgi:hypothetical protein
MTRLGFKNERYVWFREEKYPEEAIKKAVTENLPIYLKTVTITDEGKVTAHANVIVGFDKENLTINDPNGIVIKTAIEKVKKEGKEIYIFSKKEKSKGNINLTETLTEKIKEVEELKNIERKLRTENVPNNLIEYVRTDDLGNEKVAKETAKESGLMFLATAFETSDVIVLPQTKDGTTELVLIHKNPKNPDQPILRRLNPKTGWSKDQNRKLEEVLENWPTNGSLPLISVIAP